MKVKQYVYITDADQFIRGEIKNCFALDTDGSYEGRIDGWFLAGEVELNINTDEKKIRQSAVEFVEKAEETERAEHEVKMNMLAEKKQSLLAIEHKP